MGGTRAGWVTMLCVASAVALSACGSSASAPTPTPRAKTTTAARPVPTPPPSRPAPLIVQIENSPDSRPQSGLSTATTIYEYVSEGGIGRFSALFDVPPPVGVGPVRSARLATLELLRFYQGVLVYSGASIYIDGLLRQGTLKHLDEDTAFGDLFRIGTREPPHNLYTDGTHLTDLLGRAAVQPVTYTPPFISTPPPARASSASLRLLGWGASRSARSFFASPAPAPVSRPAASLTVPISYREQPSFTWDAGSAGWIRHEATGTFLDANTNNPVTPHTVIVQQVDIRTAPEVHDVAGELGVRHTLTGTGPAQVFSGGTEYDATWTQPAQGPARYTLLDGSPAPISPGLTWVCFVPTGSPATVR